MKKFLVILLVALAYSVNGQIFYGTPSYQISGNGTVFLTNDTSNIWFLTSVAGASSNNVPMAGSFEVWHIRGNYSNKVFMFEFADVTNFVWYPESNIRIGRNDNLALNNKTTNTMFTNLGQER